MQLEGCRLQQAWSYFITLYDVQILVHRQNITDSRSLMVQITPNDCALLECISCNLLMKTALTTKHNL